MATSSTELIHCEAIAAITPSNDLPLEAPLPRPGPRLASLCSLPGMALVTFSLGKPPSLNKHTAFVSGWPCSNGLTISLGVNESTRLAYGCIFEFSMTTRGALDWYHLLKVPAASSIASKRPVST